MLSYWRLNNSIRILWDITYACNLRCKHCFIEPEMRNKTDQQLSKEATYRLLQNVCSGGIIIQEFNFQGGEPLVASNFLHAVKWFGENEIPWSINTNGTLWDDCHYQIIKKYPPIGITVSIDGADSASHDWLRGQGVFSRLVATIKSLQEIETRRGPVAIDAICVLNQRNVKEFISLLDMAVQLGIREMVLNTLSIAGRAIDNWSILQPQSRELFDVLEFVCLHKGVYHGMMVYIPWATPIMIDYYNQLHSLDIPILNSGCHAIRSEMTISPRGYLRPCPNALDRLRIRFGEEAFPVDPDECNLLDKDIMSIRTSNTFEKIYELLHGRSAAPRSDKCQRCLFSSLCQTCPSHRIIGEDPTATLCYQFQEYINQIENRSSKRSKGDKS
ncbi:MAG: radical SAM protein [Nitrospirota bacterium]